MPRPSTPAAPADAAGSQRVWLAGLALALAVIAAYVTSFGGVMVFDDFHGIVDNPLIRDLRRLDLVFLPPAEGGTVDSRPILNLTLAINHAISGTAPGSYHTVNLAIHVGAALLLFGLVRRTLGFVWRAQLQLGRGPAGAGPSSPDSLLPALAVAALWALHPLQTGAVTYLIQRAESLCGLFYLLTLYCFVRGVSPAVGGALRPDTVTPNQSGHKAPPTKATTWFVLSFIACLLGMGTKEVMASAPLLVLLFDRTFVAGSWRDAWRQRGGLHAALMATWLLLAVLVLSAENRGGTAGFGTAIGWWPYLLTQCQAIGHYLRLAVWPHPLVFDYGTPLVNSVGAVLPQALLLLALLGGTVWALAKKPFLGFLGAWFFLILAPSSSIVPVATQTMAEHRMYLPLAAVLAGLVFALHALAGRRALLACLAFAAVGGGLTAARNRVYHSELALWTDTVAHRPENARARTNLGIALTEAGRLDEAVAQFEQSLALQPGNAATHLNLCEVFTTLGRPAEALAHGQEAVRLDPRSAAAHVNLGKALAVSQRVPEAISHYTAALEIEPGNVEVANQLATLHYGLGNQFAMREEFAAAIAAYRQALVVAPGYVPARANLGNALLVTGRVPDAIAEYREVLRLNPGDVRVQENLARALAIQGASR